MQQDITERGFTIVEMLTVIFIIGVLSTVAVAGLQSSREKARDNERVAHLAMLQIALEQYYNACSRQYPSSLATATANGCTGTINFGIFLRNNTLPKDPKNSTDYTYAVNNPATTDYVLRATFELTNSELQDDVDGADVYGVDCDDGSFYYCVQP